ncbi:methyl-accepting chemotaxis protein [Marivivens sp. LCG002]|uniref:methyl-accepting chemotaxis protein n=1 Tax=Marivivens sp. LCG002 TaxID=3051171 RepID=UPI002554D54C|nr:methyl-accepting chemotaxis protein [Marivivens sp. LCG002]WIV51300.1 methyl-accepting chemotaxis protein [Marivivens sp. LCG002]
MPKPQKPRAGSSGQAENDPIDRIVKETPEMAPDLQDPDARTEGEAEQQKPKRRAGRPRKSQPTIELASPETDMLERTKDVTSQNNSKDISVLPGFGVIDAYRALGTPITIADTDMNIRYVNEAATAMFTEAQDRIRADLPTFSASSLVGTNVDIFHKNPAHQRRMITELTKRANGSLTVGGYHFNWIATPVFDENNVKTAVIVEWLDNTAAVRQIKEGERLFRRLEEMSTAHDAGDIDDFIDAEDFQGAFKGVVESINGMVQSHIETKKKAINFAAELAKGNYDAELESFPRKKAFINEAMEAVRANLRNDAAEVAMLMKSIKDMAKSHDLGDIDVFADPSVFRKEYSEVVSSVNEMVGGHIETKKKAIAFVTELAKGNLEAHLEQFPRKKAFINDAMEAVRANLKGVTGEIDSIAASIAVGDLDIEIDPSRYSGAFSNVLRTMGSIITAVNEVVEEVDTLSNAIVDGRLDTQVNVGKYSGAFGDVMRAFESAFTGLNSSFGTVRSQIDQIAATVSQMTQASQSLASNSQIQSSSVDEVSSSTEETESQVRSNATAANSARDLVVSASDMATDGKGKIEEMVKAMDGIRASSQDIAKIIKVIDEIAFQTNLLALNAAVEAARAGQHGRGFAVVAQEVRNLAGRSAKAARETSELIDSATSRVQVGVRIADETSHAFTSIADDIEKVRTLVNDIATASEEQSRGVAQINVAVSEIAKSALVTSQQADELAASAAQMQASTESVTNEIARFRLRQISRTASVPQGFENLSPELLAQIQHMIAANSAGAAPVKKAVNSGLRNSDRDERGFGNF